MKIIRPGHSLIEMMMVIAAIGALVSTVGITLHTVIRTDQRIRMDIAEMASWNRLTVQFRQDVHQSREARLQGDSLLLEQNDEGTIRYQLLERSIERVVQRTDRVEHREQYPLAAVSSMTWGLAEQNGRPLAAIVVREGSPVHPTRVEALVGLDHWHMGPGAE